MLKELRLPGKSLFLMTWLSIVSCCSAASAEQRSTFLRQAQGRPNIVLFFVDDLGWTDLGFRNPTLESPNIDQLASEGINFEQAYIASPTCSPSRSTLVTGKHPARLKIVRHVPTGPAAPGIICPELSRFECR
jgi:hypothetical protein